MGMDLTKAKASWIPSLVMLGQVYLGILFSFPDIWKLTVHHMW